MDEKLGLAEISVTVQIKKASELEDLVKKIKTVPGVLDVKR